MTVVRELVAGKSPGEEQVAEEAGEAASVSLKALTPVELVLAVVRMALDRFNIDGIIPARLVVSGLTERGLQGVLLGEPVDLSRHAPQPEVKALTRHNLTVEPTPDGWRAELLFDV